MIHLRQVFQSGSEYLADGLVSQADAQNRLLSGVGPYHLAEESSLGGNARSRTEQNFVERFQLRYFEPVIAPHGDLSPQRLNQVREVIGERVVIIYDDDFYWIVYCLHKLHSYIILYISAAMSMALRSAPSLLFTSCSSYSGLLLATMPPPA